MSEYRDTTPPETERDAAREMPTVPKGLEPPPAFVGTPPEQIPGAPEWANVLFREIREEKAMLRQMMADIRMLRRQFMTFRDETRSRFVALEEQVKDLEARAETGEFNQETFAEQLGVLRREFDLLALRVSPLVDDGK